MRQTIRALIATAAGAVLALAGGHGGAQVSGIPVFWLLVIVAFAINAIAFVPAYLARTENYYDLTGALTFITVTALALLLVPERDPRAWLLALVVVLWSGRLGSFLFARARRAGGDARFTEVKADPGRFLVAWLLQALWVTFTAGAALAAITSSHQQPLSWLGYLGLVVWLTGFAVEVVADRQKSAFKADPANAASFIRSGLWSISRHPNYLGEVVLWVGVAILAAPALAGWQRLTLLSPVLVFLLLRFGSGVPILERRADERWGGQADYERYKADVPVFWPRLTPGR